MTKNALSGFALLATLATSAVQAATLTTGTGDGSLTVTVTAFGSILRPAMNGLPDDGLFDPIGGMEAATTIYESFVAVPGGSGREALDNLASDLVEVSQTETEYMTQFRVGSSDQYSITLSQSLFEWPENGQRVFPGLIQQFEITNLGETADNFDIIRYLDGDLNFVDGANDLGGWNSFGQSPYQIEVGNGGSSPFLELDSAVQGLTTAVPGRRFQIAKASDLRETILGGNNLENTVEGDEDGDNVTDAAADVALALQNFLTVQAGQTVTYRTWTYFGNTGLPAPGTDETVGLLPVGVDSDGGFIFALDQSQINVGQIVWIDPVIAVGYTYEVTGAEFASVTAPSLGLVNDPDGYIVTVGSDTFSLLSGATLNFADGVTTFTITDIATSLALDPANLTAFATGVSLRDIVAQTVVITQTPITLDVPDVAPIPLPAGGLLLGGGLLGLLALRRRRV